MIVKLAGATVGANTDAYTAGDLVGGKLTLADVFLVGPKEPYLLSITVQDLTKQNAALDFVFFDSDPTGTTFTNNAAFDVADADLPKILGYVSLTDYSSFNDNSVGSVNSIGLAVKPTGTALYAAIVARGTPTYGANELSVTFGFVD